MTETRASEATPTWEVKMRKRLGEQLLDTKFYGFRSPEGIPFVTTKAGWINYEVAVRHSDSSIKLEILVLSNEQVIEFLNSKDEKRD